MGGSVHTIKKSTEALVVASKEIGLKANVDESKYMVMSRDQNTERSHNIKNDNSSFEMVGQFKYLGTTLTNQNSMKLRADLIRGMLAIIRFRIFCLSVCYPKIWRFGIQNCNFVFCFVWVWNLVAHNEGGT